MNTIQTPQCVFFAASRRCRAVVWRADLPIGASRAGRAGDHDLRRRSTAWPADAVRAQPPRSLGGQPAARRDEDIRALRMLGAEAIHWPYPDAVYRRDPVTGTAWYDSEESIFGEMSSADNTTVESIGDRLKAVDPCARLIVPLTAGHHVDHLRSAPPPNRCGVSWSIMKIIHTRKDPNDSNRFCAMDHGRLTSFV